MNLKSLILGAAGGAALLYFLDPDAGNRRRKTAVDRAGGMARSGLRKGEQTAQAAASQAHGIKEKATHLKEQEKPQPDDVTLARKVETEVFRDSDVPKGRILVNAVEGVVTLRGELDDRDLIERLESEARKVQGVKDVENLLHMPGTPTPMSG